MLGREKKEAHHRHAADIPSTRRGLLVHFRPPPSEETQAATERTTTASVVWYHHHQSDMHGAESLSHTDAEVAF
jgi:hypothetical protein